MRIYWFFIWTNLNPLHPRMLCAKFGWSWLSGSGEEDFLILSMYFHYFVNYLPFEKGRPFLWTKLNPLYLIMYCANFGWNWLSGSGEDFLISPMYFRYFLIVSPCKKAGPFFWINMNHLLSRMLCAKFGWNRPSGSGEEDENVTSLRQWRRQRTTDKFWSEKLTWAFGLGELKMLAHNTCMVF